eukprot:1315648-Amorphochlora_amoeboformis.AAC.1
MAAEVLVEFWLMNLVESLLQEHLKRFPANLKYFFIQAKILLRKKDPASALSTLDEAKRRLPTLGRTSPLGFKIQSHIGHACFQMGDIEEASEAYDEYFAWGPEEVDLVACKRQYDILMREGKVGEAEQ